MPSLAWSTVAVLVLLLPGFFFFVGFALPEEGFTRDTPAQNPLTLLAAVVSVSLGVHVFLTWACLALSSIGVPEVDWSAVLDVVQLNTNIAPGLPRASQQAAAQFDAHWFAVPAYAVASILAGAFVGFLFGRQVVKGGIWSRLSRHAWVHELEGDRKSKKDVIQYAHVLADIGSDDRRMIYKGRLRHFGLGPDGNFAYIVLSGVSQRFFKIEGEKPEIGEDRPIGGGQSEDSKPSLLTPESSSKTPPLLVISGAAIKDVVFQGQPVRDLKDVGAPLEKVVRAIAGTESGDGDKKAKARRLSEEEKILLAVKQELEKP